MVIKNLRFIIPIIEEKITHVKVGHTSEFPFNIYWWTLKNWKNQNFEKMKKIAGYIIILHMCTKTHNHMRYSSWDKVWDRIFCHFGPSGDAINLNFCDKKHDHTMYANSDVECDRHDFLSFWAIFALLHHYWPRKLKFGKNVKSTWRYYSFTHVYHTSGYDKWFLRYTVQKRVFLSFWAIFWHLTLLTTQKMKILKKKKTPGDISILHLCNANDDHMMHGSWDIERDRQNSVSFWTIFWTFMLLPLTTQRIEILKRWKKQLEISSFYTSVP